MYGHRNPIADTSQSFINGIVDDLIDQVMQSFLIRTAHIHAWTTADSFQTLKDLNIIGTI
jgi:hypothetical protein